MNQIILIDPYTGKVGNGVNILNYSVYTVEGKYLGKVRSVEVNKNFDVLQSIVVVKQFLFWKNSRVIIWDDILEIADGKIRVKSDIGYILIKDGQKKATLSMSDSVA